MKKWTSILFLLLQILTVNCTDEVPECVFDNIIPSQLKDYIPYKKGDRMIYQSIASQLDTLIVSDIYLDSLEGFRLDCPDIYEHINCTIRTNLKDSLAMFSDMTISMFDYVIGIPNSKLIEVDGGDFQATTFGGSSNADINILPTMELDGITYSNVLLASCRNPVECSFIDSLCFVKNQGLIFYSIYGERRMKI